MNQERGRWSPEFLRTLLSIVAIPAGVALGFVLMLPVVGAPHAFPGLLMHAPEPVRDRAGLACVIVTPIVLLLAIWWKSIKKLFW